MSTSSSANSRSTSPLSLHPLPYSFSRHRHGNISAVLIHSQSNRYASEVDVEFVKRAVRAIGQCAIKIDAAAERCVNVLLDLIATKVSYVVQESIIVVKVSPPSLLSPCTPPRCLTVSDDVVRVFADLDRDESNRIFSESTQIVTPVSSRPSAPRWTSSMNRMRKRRSFGSWENMPIKSIMPLS